MKSQLAFRISLVSCLYFVCNGLVGIAQLTWYESYARCCKGNANYDSTVSTEECDLYNACAYPGYFAGIVGQKPLSWVQSNNLISFFDSKDPNGVNWKKNYANKKIRLTKGTKVFEATIVDTCGNNDCGGCCTKNAKNGYLVDMEYYTAIKNLGSTSAASGQIQFEII